MIKINRNTWHIRTMDRSKTPNKKPLYWKCISSEKFSLKFDQLSMLCIQKISNYTTIFTDSYISNHVELSFLIFGQCAAIFSSSK